MGSSALQPVVSHVANIHFSSRLSRLSQLALRLLYSPLLRQPRCLKTEVPDFVMTINTHSGGSLVEATQGLFSMLASQSLSAFSPCPLQTGHIRVVAVVGTGVGAGVGAGVVAVVGAGVGSGVGSSVVAGVVTTHENKKCVTTKH